MPGAANSRLQKPMPSPTCCYCGSRIKEARRVREATEEQLADAVRCRTSRGQQQLLHARHVCSTHNVSAPQSPAAWESAAAATEPPRRALSDITNISPLRLPTPPRRTQSTPGERPLHSHLSPLERYAVAVLTLDGQKQKDVAVKVGCSPRAVRTWSQRIGEDEDAEDSQRSGRPKLLHPSTMDALIDAAISAPKASTPRELKHKFDLSCSAKTIRRVLDDAGLFGRIARAIPPQNPRLTQLRLSFGHGYAGFDWTKVLWSDEMSIRIGPQGQTWVQRPIGEAFDPQYCVEKEKACAQGARLGLHVCCWCRRHSRVHGEPRRGADEEDTEGASDEVCEQVLAKRAVAFSAGQRSKAY